MGKRTRILATIALTLLVLFGLAQVAPAAFDITDDILQGRAWTFKLAQTFKGIKFSATTNSVTADGMKLDADTGSLDTYKDGTLTTRQRANEWIPPDCATSGDPQTFGGFCKDAASGKIRYRDAGGVKELP